MRDKYHNLKSKLLNLLVFQVCKFEAFRFQKKTKTLSNKQNYEVYRSPKPTKTVSNKQNYMFEVYGSPKPTKTVFNNMLICLLTFELILHIKLWLDHLLLNKKQLEYFTYMNLILTSTSVPNFYLSCNSKFLLQPQSKISVSVPNPSFPCDKN